MPKSKSEKVSPLLQALDASNPPSVPSYLPAHLLNFGTYPSTLQGGSTATSKGHTHLSGAAGGTLQGGKGLYSSQKASLDSSQNSSSGTTSNSLSNSFLGQSQPGFPSSCFRVKGHTEGGSGSSVTAGTGLANTSSELSDSIATSSYNSCLGHDWPDLGITLGQGSSSSKTSLMPDLGTTVGHGTNSQKTVVTPTDFGTNKAVATSKSCDVEATEVGPTSMTESDMNSTTGSGAWKASGSSVTAGEIL